MNSLDDVVVEARFRFSEWVLARRPPGRRVVARLPFVAVEVERLWGRTVPFPHSGHAWRAAGWSGPDDRMDRVRLVVPWPGGCLVFLEARG